MVSNLQQDPNDAFLDTFYSNTNRNHTLYSTKQAEF